MKGLVALCLLLATAIAGAAFFIVPSLLPAPPQAQVVEAKQSPAVRVLVAAQNLPAGTIVKKDQVRWQVWPEQGLGDGFIVESKTPAAVDEVISAAVRRGFAAGEPVTLSRLVKRGEAGFLAAALSPGMRAVSVKVDAVSGASGFILPGDSVDLMLTSQYNPPGTGAQAETKSFAEIVLSGVRVLAIDQNMKDIADEKAPAKVAATATLEVTLHQAQVIGVAGQLGRLTLVLAGLAQAEGVPAEKSRGFVEEVEVSRFLQSVKKGALDAPPAPAPMPAVAEAAPPPVPMKRSLTVYRGTAPTVQEPR